jgi:hypothetical protein
MISSSLRSIGLGFQPDAGLLVPARLRNHRPRNQTAIASFALHERGEREEVVMKKLPVLLALAAGLVLAACDNSVQPTKAPGDEVNRNPQVDKNPVPKSTTGGDQQGTAPRQ